MTAIMTFQEAADTFRICMTDHALLWLSWYVASFRLAWSAGFLDADLGDSEVSALMRRRTQHPACYYIVMTGALQVSSNHKYRKSGVTPLRHVADKAVLLWMLTSHAALVKCLSAIHPSIHLF